MKIYLVEMLACCCCGSSSLGKIVLGAGTGGGGEDGDSIFNEVVALESNLVCLVGVCCLGLVT